jgi:hypothetical protein
MLMVSFDEFNAHPQYALKILNLIPLAILETLQIRLFDNHDAYNVLSFSLTDVSTFKKSFNLISSVITEMVLRIQGCPLGHLDVLK